MKNKLCKDCKYCLIASNINPITGSVICYCSKLKKPMKVYPWIKRNHPKCPLIEEERK